MKLLVRRLVFWRDTKTSTIHASHKVWGATFCGRKSRPRNANDCLGESLALILKANGRDVFCRSCLRNAGAVLRRESLDMAGLIGALEGGSDGSS